MSDVTDICLRRGERVLIPHLCQARRFHQRLLGLMGRRPLGPGQGLWIIPCQSIHTCFMRFRLDVLFLDRAGVVLGVRRRIAPWRLVWAPRKTHSVVEFGADWLASDAVAIGDRLEFDVHSGH